MKRNTALVNGANSMPLGTNNRMAARDEADKKRKRSEEPAEEPFKDEKKAKGVNGDAMKPAKQSKAKDKTFAESVTAPAKEKEKKSKKEKKDRKLEVAVEPVVETAIKEKKSKKEKKAEVSLQPVAKLDSKTKRSRKEQKLESTSELVVAHEPEKKKSKKSNKSDEPELSSGSSDLESDAAPSSDTDSSSNSDSGSDVDSNSDYDSVTDSVNESIEDSTDDEMYGEDTLGENSAKPINIIKVVDGIAIPAPQPIIREKKKKLPAKVIREQHKQEREELSRKIAMENKRKAIAEGTFDFEAEDRRKKERQIDKTVKLELMRRDNNGEFGPKLPHPSALLKIEKEIAKDLKKKGPMSDDDYLEAEKKAMHARLLVCPFFIHYFLFRY
jgi:hypothetical protein